MNAQIILYVLSGLCFSYAFLIFVSNKVAHYRFAKLTGRSYQGKSTPSVFWPIIVALFAFLIAGRL